MTFLIQTNPLLSGLDREQLTSKRVCQLHFDRDQFDFKGRRLRYAYPCLFSEKEIHHGIPLKLSDYPEHNYCTMVSPADTDEDCEMVVIGGDHTYSLPPQEPMEIEVEASRGDTSGKQTFVQSTSSGNMVVEPMDMGVTDNQSTDIPNMASGNNNVNRKKITEAIGNKARRILNRKLKAKQIVETAIKPELKTCKCFLNEIKNITANINASTPFKLRFEDAQNLSKEFIKNFYKLSKYARTFIIMQIKLAGRKKNAVRFSTEEKVLSLTFMKESPKGYRLLRSIFSLPTKRTLNRLAEKIFFTGINENMFQILKKQTSNWDSKKKLCSIVFDEVALTPHLNYVESQDKITGFKNIGKNSEMKFCDHALVFMIRGVCASWRQAIAYYLVEGTVSAADLSRILKELVQKVADCGLTPVALVCDQGSTFRTTLKTFQSDTARERNLKGEHDDRSIDIVGQKLNIIFDPPHLLKGIRNNFLTKDMLFKGETASWEDIMTVYDLDCQLGHTKNLPRLTDQHVIPEKIKKMKVNAASQVLSARTSAMLEYTSKFKTLQNGKTVSSTMLTTARAVGFFDALFDNVNGSKGCSTKGKLRGPIKPGSKHFVFWREAIQVLNSIKFIDSKSKRALQAKKQYFVRVPSLEGWTSTIKSFERIAKKLFDTFGVQYFYPRNINQDPLENFFGRIRALNYRNVNPDPCMFINSFKSLLISNVMGPHSVYSNCEEDIGESVVDFFLLLKKKTNKNTDKENIDPQHMRQESENSESLINHIIKEKMRVHSSAYTAGFLCRKLSKKFNCKECKRTYLTEDIENIHQMISHREYKGLKQRRLSYPSKALLIIYRDLANMIHNYLNNYAHFLKVMSNLRNIAYQQFHFEWLGCNIHHHDIKLHFVKSIIRLHIHNWCNIINKILKGALDEKYVSKMRGPQKLALLKYKALRLRNRKKF